MKTSVNSKKAMNSSRSRQIAFNINGNKMLSASNIKFNPK